MTQLVELIVSTCEKPYWQRLVLKLEFLRGCDVRARRMERILGWIVSTERIYCIQVLSISGCGILCLHLFSKTCNQVEKNNGKFHSGLSFATSLKLSTFPMEPYYDDEDEEQYDSEVHLEFSIECLICADDHLLRFLGRGIFGLKEEVNLVLVGPDYHRPAGTSIFIATSF
jgi:hypothetical protein